MSGPGKMDIGAFVPEGILATDHIHAPAYDETCSRCRRPIPDEEVPLLLWLPPDQVGMLAYCDRCQVPESDS